MPVSFAEMQLAFDFVSSSGLGENRAVLDRQTGRLYWHSDFGDNLEEDEIPDDLDDERHIEITNKKDLGLGKPLALDFARQFLPHDYDEVRQIFSRRGAYGRFKALLVQRRALDRWHDFSDKAEDAALREWCADNGIELTD